MAVKVTLTAELYHPFWPGVPDRLMLVLGGLGEVTDMEPLVPVIELVTVSVAVIVCEPTVVNVAVKVPVPAESWEFEGSDPAEVEVKCAIPAYPVAKLPYVS